MNEGDNEYLVAGRFIEENELPPYFAEQVRCCRKFKSCCGVL
jgi:hypothetical protein